MAIISQSTSTANRNHEEKELTRTAVYLQSDGRPSLDSRIVWNGPSLPTLTALTTCFHIRLIHTRSNTMPLISYSIESFPDEFMLYFDWEKPSVEIICCGGNGRIVHRPKKNFLFPRSWIHFCLAVDLEKESYTLRINNDTYYGKVEPTGDSTLQIVGGGILMAGQEQDIHGGGFNIEQTYEGYLADLFIFRKALGDDILKEFTECNLQLTKDILVSFQSFDENWKVFGNTEVKQISETEPCRRISSKHVMFPETRTLEESKQLCRMLKGEIIIPKNDEDNELITNVSRNFIEKCSANWGINLWIGLKAELRGGTYQYINIYTNETASYTHFQKGYDRPTFDYHCVYMDSYKIGYWSVYPCTFKTCTMCTFKETALLRLRGLCHDSMVDHKFIITDLNDDKPVFHGFTNSRIFWNNKTWEIDNSLNGNVKGTMELTGPMQYPFGLHHWIIKGDRCPYANRILLLLTACRSDQYTCNDGTCTQKMQRCDLAVNCPDKSDETNCSAVVIPDDYIREVPPARLESEPARIFLFITIMSIQPIDTLRMKMTLDANVTLMWRDNRLDMLSLNYAETLNVVRRGEQIWQPDFLFEDYTGSEADTILRWQTFVAVMQSGPLPDDVTRVREDEIYPGSNNSLKLTQTFNVKVSCQMNFVKYPFDTQRCHFKIRMKYFTQDLVAFNTSSDVVQFLGAKNLGEYKVESLTMVDSDWYNYSGRKIIISMDNLSGFHISSTYIPTFLMVVISYSTLYFNLEDFNDRIMVSLTALLVLATLFTQISETTPKTSYLKLLDVWFVVTIFINFSIIIILVVINHLNMQEAKDRVAPIKMKRVSYPVSKRSHKVNTFCQLAIPAILFILIIAYIIFSTS
ncbi:uncharacterized protein [Palaemon carinicauda]|uniref:uncharacterized protein n=1 Tax=Palaemon carinicauda TaxID=392227 RepID=UPI0035B63678